MSSDLKKLRRTAILSFVVAPLSVLAGVFLLNSDGVDCGGHQMQQGDTCKTTVDGISTGTNSYDEQKQRNTWLAWGGVGFGFVSAGSGVRQLRRYRVAAAAAAAAPAPAPVAVPPLPYQTAPDLPPAPPAAGV